MAAAPDQCFPEIRLDQPRAARRVAQYRQSIAIIQQLTHQRMFLFTLAGLEGAMRLLTK